MNKEVLLQNELDNLIAQFESVGIKLNALSKSRILAAMKRYAIAMCEKQKKHDAETVYDDNHVCVGDIGIGILNTKNVAE